MIENVKIYEHRRPVSKRAKQVIALGAVSVLALFGAKVAENMTSGSKSDQVERQLIENMENGDKVPFKQEVLVISAGANIRKTPGVVDADTANGHPDNKATTIKQGQKLIIVNPIQDPNNPDWVGFTIDDGKSNEGDSPKQVASELAWINIRAVANDGLVQTLQSEQAYTGSAILVDGMIKDSTTAGPAAYGRVMSEYDANFALGVADATGVHIGMK